MRGALSCGPRASDDVGSRARTAVKLEGIYLIAAPRAIVWELLNDPAVLARAIPGCERLDAVGKDRFETVIKAGVGSIKGTYTGTVAIEDVRPLESYALRVDGKGTGGFVRGRGTVSLNDQGAATELRIDGDAHVGGPVAAIGQRLLGSASKMMLTEFFKALDVEARKRVHSAS